MAKHKHSYAVSVVTLVTPEQICGALECAWQICNYWAKDITVTSLPKSKAEMRNLLGIVDGFWNGYHMVPQVPGGCVTILEDCGEGDEPVKHRLDRAAIERGLQLLATTRPKTFAALLDGSNFDAADGDVFLQLCLLGEVRYG